VNVRLAERVDVHLVADMLDEATAFVATFALEGLGFANRDEHEHTQFAAVLYERRVCA
jgi:hypothetical protein